MKTLDQMTFGDWSWGGSTGFARYEFSDDFVDENGVAYSGPSAYLEVPTTISGNVVTIPAYPNFPETEAAVLNNGVTVTCYLLDSTRNKKAILFDSVRIYTSLPSVVGLDELVLANGASRIQRDTDVWTKEQVIDYVESRPPAAKMTALAFGIGRLRVPAADPADPELIGSNDPLLGAGGGLNVINVTDDPYNADNTGATNTTTAINSAITAAALTSKRVYLPTGTYLINPASFAGTLFALNSTGMEIFGDGQGKTELRFPDSITAANDLDLFNISAAFCSIHDLSIRGASTVTGNFAIKMINIAGGYKAEVYRNEIYNLNSNNSQTAGAMGIHLHGLAYNEVSTTLGTTIAAGTRTVTPASMNKIYAGRRVTVALGVSPTIIGSVSGGEYFKGKIKAIAKYDSALSGAHVSAISSAVASLGANWWTAGGASGAVFAYQPKSAASYAASKTDLTGNGYTASDTSSFPSWNSTDGWVFDGSGQTLTNLANANQKPMTVIVRLEISDYPSGAGTSFNYSYLGSATGGLQAGISVASKSIMGRTGVSGIASSTSNVPLSTDVVLAITYDGSGNWVAYQDGISDGTDLDNQTFTGATGNETVTVSSITATTFTATFASDHISSDAVTAPWQQQLYANVHDNYIHDSLIATAIIVNGSANTLRNNTIIRVGNTNGRHGFYVQAGNNLIEGNWIEGVGGYSLHQYLGNATTDGSQNKYIGNTSLNPGTLHMVANSELSDGTNPLVGAGVSLDRSVLVTGNVFRSNKGQTTVDINITNALAANNIFENATLRIGADSVAQGNVLRVTDTAITDTTYAIQAVGARSVVQGNRILNWPGSTVIRLDGANSQAIGNTIQGATGSGGVMFSAPAGAIIRDNYASTDTGKILGDLQNADLTIENNIFSTGATYAFTLISTATGVIRNNKFITGAIDVGGINKDLYFDTNIIPLASGGQGMTFGRENGRALFIQNADPTVTTGVAGLLLKLDASGELDIAKTTDTRFIGVSTRLYSNATAVTTGNLVTGQPGTIAIVAADAAWTVGNVFVISVTTDGKVHDTGSQTPPAAPASYGVFLDSGGSAGNARVLIVRTL